MNPLIVEQGTIILYEDRFPKVVKYDYTSTIASYRGDLLFEKKNRPAIVLSKETDVYGNWLIAPLSTKDNPYTNIVPLLDWEGRLNQKSFVKLNDIKTVDRSTLLNVIGKVSETDLARILVNVYKIF